ncbi:Hypothetical predicted protein [Paramuricea clavata]|uniref:Uncharacterized protein n=1 Tax=Paramuricea clavata TaxID=317549 RepID=A0A7D9I2K2_PARCT|nr:Hypothetical predicted protein [Paramuricea clavata]
MAPPSAAQLTKSQVQQMRDWRMQYGQSVPQNTVRNMSTKDNPGTLPINLYVLAQPASKPLEFSKITENGTQTDTHHANTHNILHSTGDVVFLASYANCGRMMIYHLQEPPFLKVILSFHLYLQKKELYVKVNAKEIPGSQVETVCRR